MINLSGVMFMKKRNYIISVSLLILFLSVNKSYSALEAEWQYNEGGIIQITHDETSNDNDLTIGSTLGGDPNDPEFSSDKPIDGYSMSFDGINDYLWRTNTSSLSPSSDYTLATWVKLSTLALGDQDILISNIGAYNASGGYQLAFYMDAGNPHLGTMYRPNSGGNYPDTGVGISLSSLAYEADTWYHVASTFDSSGGNTTVKLFLDGKKVIEGTYSGVTSYNNTPYFFVGTNYDGDGYLDNNERELNGKMDETRVYSHDLSETSVRTLAEIDITWKAAVSDLTSNKARWEIPKIPTYSTNVILPNYGASYTVTLDGDAEINDLEVGENVIAYLGNYTLTVEDGANIDGTLELAGAHYAGDGSMSTGSNSLVKGYGTIDQSFSNNTGTIKAQNGLLSIDLSANDSEGVLSADTGATLLIRNNHDLTNRDQIILNGGTLKSPSIYNLINANSDDSISGYGIIDNYYVNIGPGSLTAQGNNKTLTLNEGFSSNQSSGTINIQSGATLNVLQSWTNYATVNMTGGSITGSTMAQNNGATGLLVTSGDNSIQNVTFSSGSKNIISNNSTLTITGTATLSNASITESGLGGNFNIGNNAIVQGYGTINPDMIADGNLIANSANNQLNVNGALQINSNRSVYATSFGISNLNGSVTNFGNIYSNSSTVNINGSLTNSGDVYSNSGSFVNINGSLTNSGEVYSNGGTLILNGQIYNRSDIYVDSGSMIIEGTIKEGIQETGNFKATNGLMEINGHIEQNARNTFTASNGGTILFDWSFATQDLWQTNSLIIEGGTINLEEGKTLTNSAGKQISGYGTLLGENRNLVNEGTILASAGTLNVHGNIQNSGVMQAEGENNSLVIGSTLQVDKSGSVSALDKGIVTIMSDLINNGQIYVDGNSSTLHVLDTTPQGLGEFVASNSGCMYFSDGFSNSELQKEKALILAGGKITLKKGTITNAKNKVISGYGSLLDSDTGGGLIEKNLMNHGSIIASGGDIYIYGKEISNKGLIYADSSNNIIMQSESFINGEDGLVKAENGADITINNSNNSGTIKCAGTSHVIFNGDATGDGIYSLDFGRMEFRGSLIMGDKTVIDDRDVDGSGITVYGNLTKTQGSLDAFNADQIDMHIFTPKMTVTTPHLLTWEAIDEGANYLGLLDNLAIGHLIFGDDFGAASSDLFELTGDSIIYCYGLSILTDAELDLGGNTIYYLREDDIVNNILGTGFENYGSYHNGDIVEITAPIPEPCAMLLFLFIGLPFIFRSKKVL